MKLLFLFNVSRGSERERDLDLDNGAQSSALTDVWQFCLDTPTLHTNARMHACRYRQSPRSLISRFPRSINPFLVRSLSWRRLRQKLCWGLVGQKLSKKLSNLTANTRWPSVTHKHPVWNMNVFFSLPNDFQNTGEPENRTALRFFNYSVWTMSRPS